jgi:hypothetical protein
MPAHLHLIVAAVLLLLGISAFLSVIGGGASHAITVRDLRVAPASAAVPEIHPERALEPIVPGLDEPQGTPFHLGAGREQTGLRVPRPPAPPLAFPALPPLPLPVSP